jgi:hypothetical protein
MFEVIADGIAWVDSDGNVEFTWQEAASLAEGLENIGYDVDIESV